MGISWDIYSIQFNMTWTDEPVVVTGYNEDISWEIYNNVDYRLYITQRTFEGV